MRQPTRENWQVKERKWSVFQILCIIQDKPGVEQFINMNRGINDGENVPRELLESLYER